MIKELLIGFCVVCGIIMLIPLLINPAIWGIFFIVRWAIKKF